MPIIEVNGHRAFEQDEVGNNLLGYVFIVDKSGETEAEKIGAERIVLTGAELDGVNNYQQITGRKYLTNRLLEYQPADIASANNLVLTNGRFFRLTGTTELQTINNNGWSGGSWILIEIKSGTTVKHAAADYGLGNYNGILLAVQTDYTATQDLILMLVYDSDTKKWKEVGGTSVAMVAERDWYVAIKRNQPCLVSAGDGIITGFVADYLDTLTVTNEGTATPTKSADGSYISFGSGTVFGVKIYNGATLVHQFPCNENNLYKNIVTDIVTENYYLQTGFDSIGAQDSYFPSNDYGFTIVIEGSSETTVNYNSAKEKIFVEQ